jgi:hypothetical protein
MMAKAKPTIQSKAPPRRGPPRALTAALKEELCERIAAGELVKQICADKRFPNPAVVYVEVVRDPSFGDQYARAMQARMTMFAEQLLEIADDGSNDWMEIETQNGRIKKVVDKECVERSKLRFQSRQWLMSKIAPKKYGDKVDLNVGGLDGGPIQITISPDDAKL